MSYVVVKWAHILSSTLLFGTGLGVVAFLSLVIVFYLMVAKPM